QLAVEIHAIRIVDRRALEEVEPSGLSCRDDVAKLRVGEGAITDEVDALHLRRDSLLDLEHEIHAVLVKLDDLRLDHGREPALAPVDVENALRIRQGAGARID